MKSILCVLIFIFVISPLSAVAENKTDVSAGDDARLQVQSLIDSRVFLKKDGVEQMLSASANMNNEWKETLFEQNQKYPSLGWWSLALPSLGNWLVGDYTGGKLSIIGYAGGIILFYLGFSTAAASYGGSNSRGGGALIAGLVFIAGSYVFSTASAIIYAGYYNTKLKAGLGISAVDSIEFNRRMTADNRAMPVTSPELFHLDLLSYSF